MSSTCYTDEAKAELMANPFTHHVTDHRVVFTLAFKEFVIREARKPGMTSRKIFKEAGYRDGLFPDRVIYDTVMKIKKEAASPDGLKPPKGQAKPASRKKRPEADVRALEHRVRVLEQELRFLKKIRFLELTGELPPEDTS